MKIIRKLISINNNLKLCNDNIESHNDKIIKGKDIFQNENRNNEDNKMKTDEIKQNNTLNSYNSIIKKPYKTLFKVVQYEECISNNNNNNNHIRFICNNCDKENKENNIYKYGNKSIYNVIHNENFNCNNMSNNNESTNKTNNINFNLVNNIEPINKINNINDISKIGNKFIINKIEDKKNNDSRDINDKNMNENKNEINNENKDHNLTQTNNKKEDLNKIFGNKFEIVIKQNDCIYNNENNINKNGNTNDNINFENNIDKNIDNNNIDNKIIIDNKNDNNNIDNKIIDNKNIDNKNINIGNNNKNIDIQPKGISNKLLNTKKFARLEDFEALININLDKKIINYVCYIDNWRLLFGLNDIKRNKIMIVLYEFINEKKDIISRLVIRDEFKEKINCIIKLNDENENNKISKNFALCGKDCYIKILNIDLYQDKYKVIQKIYTGEKNYIFTMIEIKNIYLVSGQLKNIFIFKKVNDFLKYTNSFTYK